MAEHEMPLKGGNSTLSPPLSQEEGLQERPAVHAKGSTAHACTTVAALENGRKGEGEKGVHRW